MTILLEKFPEAQRPYSQMELKDIRSKTKQILRLSEEQAEHSNTRYFYYVKRGGRKEQQLLQNPNNRNVGTCSVTWKLDNTSADLKDDAYNLVDEYMYNFETEPEHLSFRTVMLERIFYTWLFEKTQRN